MQTSLNTNNYTNTVTKLKFPKIEQKARSLPG
jgi:hypothetical protein